MIIVIIITVIIMKIMMMVVIKIKVIAIIKIDNKTIINIILIQTISVKAKANEININETVFP